MHAQKLSEDFIKGFVKRCYDHDYTPEETTELLHSRIATNHLDSPHVKAGFDERIAQEPDRWRKLARWMSPGLIRTTIETQLHYSPHVGWKMARYNLGMPEPGHTPKMDALSKRANTEAIFDGNLSNLMESWDAMPLDQKILLAGGTGGLLNALRRGAAPTVEDEAYRRNLMERMLRGGVTGLTGGAGGAIGAESASQAISPESPIADLLTQGVGGLIGGTATTDFTRAFMNDDPNQLGRTFRTRPATNLKYGASKSAGTDNLLGQGIDQVGELLQKWDELPVDQKLLYGGGTLAGLNALKRVLMPNQADRSSGRGMVSRGLRGALGGGITGGSAALGSHLGNQMTSGSPWGSAAGAVAGGAAGEIGRRNPMLPMGVAGGIGLSHLAQSGNLGNLGGLGRDISGGVNQFRSRLADLLEPKQS